MKYLDTRPPKMKLLTTLPKAGCNWCTDGTRPGPEGICEGCYVRFKRLLNSKAWRSLRLAGLSANPTCQDCGLADSHIADHTFPWEFWPDLFWHTDYIRYLCDACHNRKGIKHDGLFGRKRMPTGLVPPVQDE